MTGLAILEPQHIDNPTALIDPVALSAALHAAADANPLPAPAFRAALLQLLKDTLKQGRAEAERRLSADGRGTQCAINLAYAMDEILCALYSFSRSRMFPALSPSASDRIAMVAVGGYGRGTLAPGSDVDLLFLIPYKQTPWCESVIEFVLYALWDTRLKVGHSVRSIDECIRLARSDGTIMTATLEARFICGDEALFNELTTRYR